MHKLLAVALFSTVFAAESQAACDFWALRKRAVELLEPMQVKVQGRAAYRLVLKFKGGGEVYIPPKTKPPNMDFKFREVPFVVADASRCAVDAVMESRRVARGRLTDFLGGHLKLAGRVFGPIGNDFNSQTTTGDPQKVAILNKWKFCSRGGYVLYTPYSADLARLFPELAYAGRDHLLSDLTEALSGLRERNLLEPGSDRLARSLAPVIYSSEGIDDFEFRTADENLRRILADQPFVTLGANGDIAYVYKVSSAGAKGPMQVWYKSCRDIRGKYPGAKLDRDCNGAAWGSHKHIGNVAAFVLELQLHRDTLVRILGPQVAERSDFLRMLAASYNGGPGWVVQGYRLRGDSWDQPDFKKVARKVQVRGRHKTVVRIVRLGLRPQTVNYLLKCDYLTEREKGEKTAIGGGAR